MFFFFFDKADFLLYSYLFITYYTGEIKLLCSKTILNDFSLLLRGLSSHRNLENIRRYPEEEFRFLPGFKRAKTKQVFQSCGKEASFKMLLNIVCDFIQPRSYIRFTLDNYVYFYCVDFLKILISFLSVVFGQLPHNSDWIRSKSIIFKFLQFTILLNLIK